MQREGYTKNMTKIQFQEEELNREYERKLEKLRQLSAGAVDEAEYLWDATVQRYASTMSRVRKLLTSEGLKEQITSGMIRNLDTFLQRCSNAEFHIALVGAIKAGKSTLINALLGYEYASTKVTPETAALTKFRRGNRNYVHVSFYSKNEWERLWKSANDSKAEVFLEEYRQLNANAVKEQWVGRTEETFDCKEKEDVVKEILRWTSSRSPEHYFVKEVEVGLKDIDLPEGVVLVDTPGLDDVVEYRSNITREYIDRANAVLVCVKSDALTGQEMATIYSVFSNTRYKPEKVYIVATQLDTLNRPNENWKEQQEEWIKYLKGPSAYGDKRLAERNLIPVSAYLYTLMKEYNSLSNDDDKMVDLQVTLMKLRCRNIDEDYQRIMEFTRIDYLRNKIQKEIIDKYKEFLIEDISESYKINQYEIQSTMKKIKESQKEIIKTAQGSLEEIRKKQEEYTKKYQEAEADKQNLDKLLKTLQTLTKRRADELESSIKALGGK